MGTDYEIVWLGWNTEGTSDKVWGYLRMADRRHFAFWGRRGKTLQFKDHGVLGSALPNLKSSKAKKGYRFVDPVDYDRLVQDFITELEINCMTAILSDTVK